MAAGVWSTSDLPALRTIYARAFWAIISFEWDCHIPWLTALRVWYIDNAWRVCVDQKVCSLRLCLIPYSVTGWYSEDITPVGKVAIRQRWRASLPFCVIIWRAITWHWKSVFRTSPQYTYKGRPTHKTRCRPLLFDSIIKSRESSQLFFQDSMWTADRFAHTRSAMQRHNYHAILNMTSGKPRSGIAERLISHTAESITHWQPTYEVDLRSARGKLKDDSWAIGYGSWGAINLHGRQIQPGHLIDSNDLSEFVSWQGRYSM